MGVPATAARVGSTLVLFGVLILLVAPPVSASASTGNPRGPLAGTGPTSPAPVYMGRLAERPATASPAWSNISTSATPISPGCRSGAGFAWDPLLFEAILFGGIGPCPTSSGTVVLGDTWAYANGSWRNLTPTLTLSPSPRYQPVMVYDPEIGQILLFGGGTTTATYNDTWTFGTGGWTPLSVTPTPPARLQASMAYDGADRDMVLFGGYSGGGAPVYLSDTWIFHRGQWSSVSGPGPTARRSQQMGSLGSSAGVLLFGGVDATATALSDSWSFVSGGWSVLSPTTSPPGRWDGRLVYDPDAGAPVLFGGCTALGCATALNDTYLWSAGDWAPSSGAPGPSPRGEPAMDFDPQSHYLVLFSGGGPTWRPDDTWSYYGPTSGWTNRTALTLASPPCRSLAAMEWENGSATGVLFGGRASCGADLGEVLDDTWAMNAGQWYNVSDTLSAVPSARFAAGSAFDPILGCWVLFGGWGPSGAALADTWEWCGSSWSLGPSGPPALGYPAMAYDPSEGAIVLFGGFDGAGYSFPSNATWMFTSAGWHKATATLSPGGRGGALLAFDGVALRLIGGRNLTSVFGDEWTWSGATWVLDARLPAPGPGWQESGSWDPSLSGIVLSDGCTDLSCLSTTSQLWLFVGNGWIDGTSAASPAPPAATGAAFAGSLDGGADLRFSGGGAAAAAGTWTLRPPLVAHWSTAAAPQMDAWFPRSLTLVAGGGGGGYSVVGSSVNPHCLVTGLVFSCTFPSAGPQSLQPTVIDRAGASFSVAPLLFNVHDDPNASATASPATGEAPQSIRYVSTVTGGWPPYAYLWSFGGGVPTATTPNASVLYAAGGAYGANLTVTDGAGVTAHASASALVVPGLIAELTATPISYSCANGTLSVRVAATSSGGVGPFTDNWTIGTTVGTGASATFVIPYSGGATAVGLLVTDSLNRTATATGNVSITLPYCTPGGGSGGGGGFSAQTLIPFIPAVVLAVLLAIVIIWYRRKGAASGATPLARPADPPGVPPPDPTPASTAPGPTGPAVLVGPGGLVATGAEPLEAARGDGSMADLIVLHLARQRRLGPGDVAPPELTQQGLETALGRPQSSFARALSRLEETGVVVAEIRHIRGGTRRRKAYSLTSLGETLAKELRNRGPGTRPPP